MANLYIRKMDESTVREMKAEAVLLGLTLAQYIKLLFDQRQHISKSEMRGFSVAHRGKKETS
jgi:hypothetical protein